MRFLVFSCLACACFAAASDGAEGFGAETPGGAGGRRMVVATLADSGPGSLREAVMTPGPRTVVFQVAGEIRLQRALGIREPFITIDGSSAPGGGITLLDDSVGIGTHDVIVRYLRVHAGDKGKSKLPDVHGFSLGHARNVVIDHCSAYWGIDEVIGMYQCQDITVQWSILAEGLFHSGHEKGPHSMGILIGGDQTDRVSLHPCLLASNNQRNPRLQNGVIDVRNNVFYNWGSAGGYFSGNTQVNFIGNLYLPGPDSSRSHKPILITPEVELYLADSEMRRGAEKLAGWDLVTVGKNAPARKAAKPFATPAVRALPLDQVYEAVLTQAGATKPARDAADTRVVRGVRENRGKIIDRPEQAQ